MNDRIAHFERIVRIAKRFTEARTKPLGEIHPFEERNIHPRLPMKVKQLFDDGHYPQATFEAYKFIDKEVLRISGMSGSGFRLMMKAFAEDHTSIQLTPLTTESEKDEQKGYQFLFAGSMLALRNPRGHEYTIIDSPDNCLDYLTLASLLLRKLEDAGYK